MDIRQDDSLQTTLSSLDFGSTLDEIDCSTYSPLKGTHSFYRNSSLSTTKSRVTPPPLPTTPKPMAAVTRSPVEDFLLMEYSLSRGSLETSLDTTTDSYSDVDNSMRSEDYRVTHANQSGSKLTTFLRNSPTRIATRKRHSQRSLLTIHSSESMEPDSTPSPRPARPRSLRVWLKGFIYKKIIKMFA